MRPFWALIRKEVQESRWTLGLSAAGPVRAGLVVRLRDLSQ